jgi:hypothetical protein
MLKSILSAAAIIAASAGSLQAALHAYEGFNYTTGAALNGGAGGTGEWDSAWRAGASPALTNNIAPAGLSYPGLVVSGSAVDTTNAATSIDFRDVGPYSTGDVWISFLARPEAANAVTGTNDNFFGLSVYESTDAASGSVMSISKSGNSAKWGLLAFPTNANGSGPNGTAGSTTITNAALPDIVANTTYLLVTRFHFAAGVGADTADSVSLYVNPTPGEIPASASVEYIDATSPITGGLSFDRMRLGAQNGRDWLVDEIRIGDTFADVAPAIPPNTDFVAPAGTGIEDFHVIRNNYLTGTSFAQGDANFDGAVNHRDFFLWRTEFVNAGGSLEGLNLAIPEPSTAVGALVFGLALMCKARSRRSV